MPANRFRSLQPERVVETVDRLERRIAERFGESSLRQVAAELLAASREAVDRAHRIRRANIPLRLLTWLLIGCVLALITWVVRLVRLNDDVWKVDTFPQVIEASLGSIVFIGAAILFVMSWELRLKRRNALIALHELRSLAHIVDMHQLTKDPERLLHGGQPTASSPRRTMTPFQLGRYLDYSCELLSLISKTAAIYVQEFPDSVVLAAVNEITSLTSGMSRNIWQKIMLLERPDSQTPVSNTLSAVGSVTVTSPAAVPTLPTPPVEPLASTV